MLITTFWLSLCWVIQHWKQVWGYLITLSDWNRLFFPSVLPYLTESSAASLRSFENVLGSIEIQQESSLIVRECLQWERVTQAGVNLWTLYIHLLYNHSNPKHRLESKASPAAMFTLDHWQACFIFSCLPLEGPNESWFLQSTMVCVVSNVLMKSTVFIQPWQVAELAFLHRLLGRN